MKSKTVSDIAFFTGIGAFVGALPAAIAAGAYMTWRLGGDVTAIDWTTAWTLSPWGQGQWGEPFETGTLVGFGVLAAFLVAGGVLGYRPTLTSHGSARWQTPREIAQLGMAWRDPMKTPGPILAKLGRPKGRAPYVAVARDQVHTVVAAPTGSGKGVGVVIPTLLTYAGSVIVLDIKGENYAETARARAKLGDRVFKFAPGDTASHRFNPLGRLAEVAERDRFEAARSIAANLLVPVSKGQEGFVGGARDIFAAAALLAVERDTPTIAAVHDMLSAPGRGEELFGPLAAEARSPAARGIFSRMAASEPRILDSYKSVLFETGLALWAFSSIRSVTEASDFELDSLRRRPTSIYLVVTQAKLTEYAPLMRLMFKTLIDTLQARLPGRDERYPVLMLMDEFSSLGDMGNVPQTMTSIRGYGGRFLIILTQLADLHAIYQEHGKERILGNADVQLFMATSDTTTPEHISKSIGEFTRASTSKSWSSGEWRTSYQSREEGARLIRPEDLRRLPADEVVMLVRGTDPIRAKKVRYFEDRQLKKLHAAQARVAAPEVPWNAMEADPAVPVAVVPATRPAVSSEEALRAEIARLAESDRPGLMNLIDIALDAAYGPRRAMEDHAAPTTRSRAVHGARSAPITMPDTSGAVDAPASPRGARVVRLQSPELAPVAMEATEDDPRYDTIRTNTARIRTLMERRDAGEAERMAAERTAQLDAEAHRRGR